MTDDNYDIDVHELMKMRQDGKAHTVLDIREPEEVAICYIEGSVFIPMLEVTDKLQLLPREHPIIITCHIGLRSSMIAEYLQNIGFDNARNLAGGIDEWARRIDPDMRRY